MVRWRPSKSISSKLFLILFLSGILTQLAVIAGIVRILSPRPEAWGWMRENVQRYTAYLAGDLARDPSLEHAKQLLYQTELDVGVEGAASWQTSPDFLGTTRSGGPEMFPLLSERPLIEATQTTPRGQFHFRFLGPKGPPILEPAKIALLLGCVFLVNFAVCSFGIFRILKPVGALSHALKEAQLGNLSLRVLVKGEDELGRLSQAFNEMAARIDSLLQDKEQLLLEISHEFRAPLARISAASALIDDSSLHDPIQKDISELNALIHALVTSAQIEARRNTIALTAVNLVGTVEEVLETFPGEKARLLLVRPLNPLFCLGHGPALRTAVKNLVENALKYSPKGKPIHIWFENEAEHTLLLVQDEGQGISKEELSQIFQPFFRSERAVQGKASGLGLGLGLCRRIIEAHGGNLWLSSRGHDQGTTATLRLPKAIAPIVRLTA